MHSTNCIAGPGIMPTAWCHTRRKSWSSPILSVSLADLLLVCELRGALAVCVYDDTQGVGGLLHLRYVATSGTSRST